MNGAKQRWLLSQSRCHMLITGALYLVQACGDVLLCLHQRLVYAHEWLTEWCTENLCQAFFMAMECVKEINAVSKPIEQFVFYKGNFLLRQHIKSKVLMAQSNMSNSVWHHYHIAQLIGSFCISSQWAFCSTFKFLVSACCGSYSALQKPSTFPSSTCIV